MINQKFILKCLAIGFFIGLILILVYGYYLDKGYSYLSQKNMVNSIVVTQTQTRNVSRVDLRDGQKFILPFARNYKYKTYDLHNVVSPGDMILKRENSDTLLVKRAGDEYFFILGKSINENLKQ